MRIALVSPYSWSYPGGVTRHIEALAEHFIEEGHHVRVFAPYDPPDRLATVAHRGARPAPVEIPGYLVSLGRTVGFKANGAVSNLSIDPHGMAVLHRGLREGAFDVVHIHEPVAPIVGWMATEFTQLPLVGTFHSYSTKAVPNGIANLFGARLVLNHLHVRIAVSEAAAWTGRRWFGGRYRVIPNGVHVDPAGLQRGLQGKLAGIREDGPLRILFIGQAVERKGLPLLLSAFEALRERVPAELTVVGPSEEELAPMILDAEGIRALGKIGDAAKHAELERADVLCAPSLGGESFGMVLTEAFAAGTPVIASDIAGYRDVVRDGHDGVLVPPGDAQALAEAMRDLAEEPERRLALARAAAADVARFAWPRIAGEVLDAYAAAIAVPEPQTAGERIAVRAGVRPADLQPREAARRLPSLERKPALSPRRRAAMIARRIVVLVFMFGALALGLLALRKIGLTAIGSALINSSPSLVVLGLALMCSAMAMRGVSWFAILRSAMPRSRIRMIDSMQGIFIGVLMSSTLPARLGEPSRALVVARRSGRPRENLPIVLGTLVSQTLMNILALIILGAIMFSSVNIFAHHQDALLAVAIAPTVLLVAVILAPVLLRFGGSRSSRLAILGGQVRRALIRVRAGLTVFRHPRLAAGATAAQLAAWALQCLSCYVLLQALGLGNRTDFGAAAAVLFAVNITAVLPATPANLGVFQAACATVLHAGWHVSLPDGLAYGVILQAVEVATAVLMGMPALVKEGMSWKEVRLSAMHSSPVKLPARGSRGDSTVGAER